MKGVLAWHTPQNHSSHETTMISSLLVQLCLLLAQMALDISFWRSSQPLELFLRHSSQGPHASLLMSFAAFACISCLLFSHNRTRPVSWWARRLFSLAFCGLAGRNVRGQRRPPLIITKRAFLCLLATSDPPYPAQGALLSHPTHTTHTDTTQDEKRLLLHYRLAGFGFRTTSAQHTRFTLTHTPSPSPIPPAHLHRQPWRRTHRRLTWHRTTLASCGGVTRPWPTSTSSFGSAL